MNALREIYGLFSSLSDWDQFWLAMMFFVLGHFLGRPWIKLGDALDAYADLARAKRKRLEAETEAAKRHKGAER